MNIKYEIIIPIANKDIDKTVRIIPYLKKYIGDNIVVIASKKTLTIIQKKIRDKNIRYLDEDTIIDGLTLRNVKLFLEYIGGDINKSGWYFQQFLKYAFSHCAQYDYYLSWDADTVPCGKKYMFSEEGKPIFDMKDEYHIEYFNTIKNILNIDKCVKESFISEHMLFDKKLVKELIGKIQLDSNISWWVNILKNINIEDINNNAFSEFETYGTYIKTYYPDKYMYRKIKAIRYGADIFETFPDENVLEWLNKSDYYSISIEGDINSNKRIINNTLYNNALFRKVINANIYIFLCRIKMHYWRKRNA